MIPDNRLIPASRAAVVIPQMNSRCLCCCLGTGPRIYAVVSNETGTGFRDELIDRACAGLADLIGVAMLAASSDAVQQPSRKAVLSLILAGELVIYRITKTNGVATR